MKHFLFLQKTCLDTNLFENLQIIIIIEKKKQDKDVVCWIWPEKGRLNQMRQKICEKGPYEKCQQMQDLIWVYTVCSVQILW